MSQNDLSKLKAPTQLFGVLAAAIVLSACSSVPEPQAVVVEDTQSQQSLETIRALSELAQVKEEVKVLRNIVEELQFGVGNAARRQQDITSDFDRRLTSLESTQQQSLTMGAQQPGVSSFDVGVQENVAAAADAVVVVEPGDSNTQSASAAQTAVTVAEQEAYDEAFGLLKQSRYEEAVASFEQVVNKWPGSELSDDAYYWMSEARYVNRQFELALTGFTTIVTRYPNSPRVPEALLKIGYIKYDIGAYEEAANTFRSILTKFPGHQVTASAQTRLRRIEQTIQ